jgi:hypothetical protein
MASKKPDKHRKVFNKRPGAPTAAEKDFVAQLVADQPAEMTDSQVNALARTLRRTKETTKGIIEEAKNRLIDRSARYADIHILATEAALADGDNEQALKGSQWALTNISGEGSRIVEKAVVEQGGAKIMIGIKLGGIDQPVTAIALAAPEPTK